MSNESNEDPLAGSFDGIIRPHEQAQTGREPQLAGAHPALDTLEAALLQLRLVHEELQAQNEELIRARAEAEVECLRYQDLFESAPDGYIVTDRDGLILECNRHIAQLLRESRERISGKPLRIFFADFDHEVFDDLLLKLQMGGEDRITREATLLSRGGGQFPAILDISTAFDPEPGRTRLRWLVRDVADLRSVEHELRERQNLLRGIVDTTADGVITIDSRGTVHSFSGAAERMFGYLADEVVGSEVNALLPTFPRAVLVTSQCLAECNFLRDERQILGCRADGSMFPVEFLLNEASIEGEPRFILVLRDLNRRTAMEDRFLQAQKMEAVGRLAGGIAHDFNNLLVSVIGNLSFARPELPEDCAAHGYLDRADQAAQRLSDLANQMLAFSGRARFTVSELQVDEIVSEMGQLLCSSIPSSVSLELDLASDLPPIEADATQFRQVIMNLITNASEALEEHGGAIDVRVGLSGVDDTHLLDGFTQVDVPPQGPCVFIEVRDDGPGMNSETLGRLFDPFFTTKFTGRGLGMSVVLGVVRRHGGAIQVRSRPREGTCFRLLFPVCQGGGVSAQDLPSAPPTPCAHGTILVVEDEPAVRDVAVQLLKRAGFSVLEASDGLEAIELFSRDPHGIAAVVLDMTMPRMDGAQTHAALRKLRPAVPVVLCSGYSPVEATSRFEGMGLAGILQKPYRPAQLIEQVRLALMSAPVPGANCAGRVAAEAPLSEAPLSDASASDALAPGQVFLPKD